MMTKTKVTAGDALQAQAETIQQAIVLLSRCLDDLTSNTHPEDATWGDVTRFAHVADAADCVVERLGY